MVAFSRLLAPLCGNNSSHYKLLARHAGAAQRVGGPLVTFPVTPESRSAQADPFLSLSAFASHATYCAPQFRLSLFAFLLLFIDIGSNLNHPERYEKHHTRH